MMNRFLVRMYFMKLEKTLGINKLIAVYEIQRKYLYRVYHWQ
eukprot:UN17890